MDRAELERVREWAIHKVTTGNEPPWSWYQHMKLREALDAILAGMDATQPTGDLQLSVQRRGGGLQLVGEVDRQDTVQPRSRPRAIPLPT
jgi:hypothetical protein